MAFSPKMICLCWKRKDSFKGEPPWTAIGAHTTDGIEDYYPIPITFHSDNGIAEDCEEKK